MQYMKKAFLVSVCLQKESEREKRLSINELKNLTNTASIKIIGKRIQKRSKIDVATYAGKGFLQEIADNHRDNLDILIFDNDLSPSQVKNISEKFDIEVMDRTEIILKIFHDHARTKEAKLQVRLARLEYLLPRLKKMWTHLDRERGSAKSSGGFASRGMGEKQSEVDRRKVRNEIAHIKEELKKVMQQKKTQRKARNSNVKKISLVGYTNAGKTSLFNRLTDSKQYVKDKLFATLSSKAQRIDLSKGHNCLISDTVGFIKNLPHQLVASFRATLKDTTDSDLILHVVDIAEEAMERRIEAVNSVLEEINAGNIDTILVFNKVDLLSENELNLIDNIKNLYPKSVFVSAKTGKNIDTLLKAIDKRINYSKKYQLFLPHTEQKTINYIHNYGKILEKEYVENGVKFEVIMNTDDSQKIKQYIK